MTGSGTGLASTWHDAAAKALHSKLFSVPGAMKRGRVRASQAPCLALTLIARGDLKREFMVTDADVVAIVQRGGRADPLVLYMHAV